MNTIIWVVIGLVVGGAIGAGLVWMLAVRRAGPMSVNEMKKENARFREEVNAHFVQTAELINELTDSYKKVFDHLSDGADRLVDSEAVRERMPQVGHSEVRLRHIGAPKDYRPSGPSAPSGRTPGVSQPRSSTDKSDDSEASVKEDAVDKDSGKKDTP